MLQLLANDCYRAGAFLYAAKAFDVLERLDPNPEYWDGKRGACVGTFQQIIARKERKEVLRDVLANAGGFTLPPFVEPLLEGRVADPKTTAQLLVPAAINLVSSPVHLLGLSLYNNPGFGALEHVAGVAAVYVTVTGTRILKGFCAFGIGGVSNLYLRGKLGSA